MYTKTPEHISVHEAAHAVIALEYGFRVDSVGILPTESRTGSRLGGHTDYFVEDPPPITEQDYLFRRAVIAYAGSAALGLVTQQDPLQLIEREDDDRGSIAAYVSRLRHLGFSELQISKWRIEAWEVAKQLTTLHLPCIKEVARVLVGATLMNGEEVKKVWLANRVNVSGSSPDKTLNPEK